MRVQDGAKATGPLAASGIHRVNPFWRVRVRCVIVRGSVHARPIGPSYCKSCRTSVVPPKLMQKPPQSPMTKAPETKRTLAVRKAKSPGKRPKFTASDVEEIFSRFATQQPEPKGELEHVNTYTLLVAVVLSAQATDAGVNKATRALFKAADTPSKMLALGEDTVRDLVKSIGLYRTKAKNVILLSQLLIQRHGGEVPEDRDALEALPGVGRKTANVVMNMAFGHATMAVDTHVFRVANRIGLSNGKTPMAVNLQANSESEKARATALSFRVQGRMAVPW